MTGSVVERTRAEVSSYAEKEHRPLGGYAALLTVYALTGSALAALTVRKRRRLPQLSVGDLALVSVATFKASRVVARDPITSPLRAPFTRFEGPADVPSEVNESVRGRGLRKAIGELITCPFCTGQWVATALIAGLVIAPRQTRLVSGVLAATAGADALQLAYSAAASAAG